MTSLRNSHDAAASYGNHGPRWSDSDDHEHEHVVEVDGKFMSFRHHTRIPIRGMGTTWPGSGRMDDQLITAARGTTSWTTRETPTPPTRWLAGARA